MTRHRPVGKALRAAIVVTLVAVLMNTVIDIGASGFYATFCSFVLLILADFGGAPRQRFLAYLGTGLVGMVLIVVGAFVAPYLPLTLVATAVVTAILAYSVLLRGYVGTAYVSLLLTYIVAVTTPQPVDTLPTALAAYFGGALVAAVAAVTMWPSSATTAISTALGSTLSAAAALVEVSPALRADATPDETTARMRDLLTAEQTLTKASDGNLSRPGSAGRRERSLMQLVDDAKRLRIALHWLTRTTAQATPADLALLQAVQQTLSACGAAIKGEGSAPSMESIRDARDAHARALPHLADDLLQQRRADEVIERADASFSFRITGLITEMVVRHTRLALGLPAESRREAPATHPGDETTVHVDAAGSPGRLLVSNFTLASPWLRRALQTAVAVTLAVATIHVLHLHEGFWVVLGIVTALKLDANTSRKTAWGAAIGTLGGFAIAVAMLWLIGDNKIALIALLPLVAFLATWFPAGRFELPLKQAGFSVWFIMLVSLAHGGLSITIDDTRIIDVGIGLLTSLVVTALMWPNGVATRVRALLAASVRATAEYFTAAYSFIASPMAESDNAALRGSATRAAQARAQAQDAFDVAISQGGEAGRIAEAWAPVASSGDHVFFAASTVRAFPAYCLAPVPDATVASLLTKYAHQLATQYERAIETEYLRAQANHRRSNPAAHRQAHLDGLGDAGGDGDLAEVSHAVRSAVVRLEEGAGELRFTVGPSAFTMSHGHAAVSMLWGLEWLQYFHWMARQTEAELIADPPTQ